MTNFPVLFGIYRIFDDKKRNESTLLDKIEARAEVFAVRCTMGYLGNPAGQKLFFQFDHILKYFFVYDIRIVVK